MMEYIKIQFGDNFESQCKLEKPLEEMFQSMNPIFCLSQRIWKPQMDIYETKNNIIINAEIAGVDKDDISVEVNTKAVKISGARAIKPPEETANYRLAEIQFGRFERVLYLPNPIDIENVSASFFNGFLEIKLAKFPMDRSQRIKLSYR